jgi:serine/threonine protein kinase
MKYIEYIKKEQKKYLSDENQTKLDEIFELIKEMIQYNKGDRINTTTLVEELKRITKIKNTDDITIPFDKNSYDAILQNSKTHSNKVLEDEDEVIIGNKYPMRVYKIGEKKLFGIEDKNEREGCNNRNSCSIVKGETHHNLNELFIHNYLSNKDENHKYIVDLYTHKIENKFFFMYIEHVPQSLNDYLHDLNIRELNKYYIESNKQKTHRRNKIYAQKEVEKQQKLQREMYESYKDADGVELGGDNCIRGEDFVKRNGSKGHLCISKDNNELTNKNCRKNYPNEDYMDNCNKDLWCKWSEGINTCKLHGEKSGQGITCGKYGTKNKCKTSNEELAHMVMENKIFEEKCIIILKAAEALQFIHDNHILHGDIKPGNIAIQKEIVDNTNKYLVKFIDVGSSRIFRNNKMYKLTFQEEEKEEEEKEEEKFDWNDPFLTKMGLDISLSSEKDPEEEAKKRAAEKANAEEEADLYQSTTKS